MHFGIFSPPVPGHIHPFGALGRELISRGHRVSFLHMRDVETRALAEDLEFLPVGENDFPPGSLPKSLATLGKLDGWKALRFTIGEIQKTSAMLLRDAPPVVRDNRVDALLVDQTEAAGGTIAEYLGLPFVTVCNALMLHREPHVPPAFSAGPWREGALSRLRNRIGYTLSDVALRSVLRTVAEYRRKWNLSPYANAGDSFSPLAQISQQPAAFDYPRRELPPHFSYVGPLRRAKTQSVPFPWDKLDGRPLVYASLGTLQNGKEEVFRTFAEAAQGVTYQGQPVQLLITHGGGLDNRTAVSFPGNPLVVPYAPQVEVLQRATLTLTHAGLNTVLDSLNWGVPLVAVPITYEQPAIARRLEWCGAGVTIPFRKLSPGRLRVAMQLVLGEGSYREAARMVQNSIRHAGGVQRAADLVEQAVQSYPIPALK